MPDPSESFGDLAVERDFATEKQVSECLKIQQAMEKMGVVPKKVGEIMAEKGYLTREQLHAVLAAQGKSIRQIGPYVIEGKLGKGAGATVYRARHTKSGRAVALKILSALSARNKKYVERFQREARISIRLRHKNLVQGYEVGAWEGFQYFAMEFVPGQAVSQLLKDGAAMAERRAVRIAIQVAEALSYIHAQGNVHRDVKPQNILVTKDGVAKLADLGLVKDDQNMGLTLEGATLGTPYYIPPEQATGAESADPRSDIYSLGATLYHMLTGTVPFGGENSESVIKQHLTEDAPAATTVNPSLSAGIAAVVRKMMAKNVDDRYQDTSELLVDLRRVGADLSPLLVSSPAHAKKRAVPVPALVGAAAGLVIGGGLVFGLSWLRLRPDGDAQEGQQGAVVVAAKADVQTEFCAAVGFASLNPDKPAEAKRRLQEFAERHPGNWAKQAGKHILRIDMVRNWRTALETIEGHRASREPLKGLRFCQSIRATFENTEYAREIDLAERDFLAAFGAVMDRTARAVDAKIATEEFIEALDLVKPFASCGLAKAEALARRLRARIEKARGESATAAADLARVASREAYRRLAYRVDDLAGQRAYREAITACRSGLRDPALSPRRVDVEKLLNRVQGAAEVWVAADAAVRKMVGGRHTVVLSMGPTAGEVLAEGSGVFLRWGETGKSPLPGSLKPSYMADLYRADQGEDSVAARVRCGDFLLWSGDVKAAEIEFKRAEALGGDVTQCLARLEAAKGEAHAKWMFGRLPLLRKQAKWEALRALIAEIKGKHGDTRFVRSKDGELRDLVALCRKELGGTAVVETGPRVPLNSTTPLFNGFDLDDWELQGGQWRVEDGYIVGSGWAAVCGSELWEDYEFCGQFRVTTGRPFVKFLARKGVAGAYCLQLVGAPGLDSVSKVTTRLSKFQHEAKKAKWHTVRIKVRGGRVTAFVDGKPACDVTDNAYPAGKVGLAAWGGDVQFKELTIRLSSVREAPEESRRGDE